MKGTFHFCFFYLNRHVDANCYCQHRKHVIFLKRFRIKAPLWFPSPSYYLLHSVIFNALLDFDVKPTFTDFFKSSQQDFGSNLLTTLVTNKQIEKKNNFKDAQAQTVKHFSKKRSPAFFLLNTIIQLVPTTKDFFNE